jgi:hypothetical protein
MFDVGRSMFDVQYVYCSGQAEFHSRCHKTEDRKQNSEMGLKMDWAVRTEAG